MKGCGDGALLGDRPLWDWDECETLEREERLNDFVDESLPRSASDVNLVGRYLEPGIIFSVAFSDERRGGQYRCMGEHKATQRKERSSKTYIKINNKSN